jgi:hypothetical protein
MPNMATLEVRLSSFSMACPDRGGNATLMTRLPSSLVHASSLLIDLGMASLTFSRDARC